MGPTGMRESRDRPVSLRSIRRGLATMVWLALVGLAAGCGSSPPPPITTPVQLTFSASADINPDVSGRAAPVVLRYYQLGGTGAFERADYFQLHDKDAALLGQDLLDRQELPLTPGATQTVAFEAKPGTKAVGIIAAYRDIDRALWRVDTPITTGQKASLTVRVEKLKLTIAPSTR
jgi:type VI secretion system protein VasD